VIKVASSKVQLTLGVPVVPLNASAPSVLCARHLARKVTWELVRSHFVPVPIGRRATATSWLKLVVRDDNLDLSWCR